MQREVGCLGLRFFEEGRSVPLKLLISVVVLGKNFPVRLDMETSM